ncbi:hypothetical protein [Nocardia sp. NPDC047038]|uniref:hypothetical protein n=1 Tax=Nocardia sp. NPDC047038 TaxID=3154338 RepID=UPI0033CDA3EE
MTTPQRTRLRALAVWWRGLRHEVVHARRLRRALLRADLAGRGMAHTTAGTRSPCVWTGCGSTCTPGFAKTPT